MKRLASFFILIVFLFLLGGQFVMYYSCLSENREAMKESIQNGTLKAQALAISLNNSQAESSIDGNEITWNGHRYDIINIEHKGNLTIVHAINDANEERLLAGLNENYNSISHQSPMHHKSARILEDFFKEYLFPTLLISNVKQEPKKVYFIHYDVSIQDGYKDYCVPPPKYLAG